MKARIGIIAATTAAAIVLCAGPGLASEPASGSSLDEVIEALTSSSPDLGSVSQLVPTSETTLATATAAGADVTVAADAVTIADGVAEALTIYLPPVFDVADPAVTPRGEAVFGSTETDSTSAVVRVLDSGSVSVQTVLHSSAAPRSYTYSIGGGLAPVLREDGGVDLVDPSGLVAGQIATPWAFDAEGEPVATSYEVSEGKVVQIVEVVATTAFPVVADPTFGHTYGIPTLYFNKTETKSAQDVSTAQTMCGIGGLLNGVLAAFCAGNAQIISNGAKAAVKDGKCVKVALGVVVAALPYTGGNCK